LFYLKYISQKLKKNAKRILSIIIHLRLVIMSRHEIYISQVNQKQISNIIESMNINVDLIQIMQQDLKSICLKKFEKIQNRYNYFIQDERKTLNNFLIWVQLHEKKKIVIIFHTEITCFTGKHDIIKHEFDIIFGLLRKYKLSSILKQGSYQCFTCEKRFLKSEYLLNHLKSHDDDLKKSYKFSDYLTLDMRRFNGCLFHPKRCKCENYFNPLEIPLKYTPSQKFDFFFSNQFHISDENRHKLYKASGRILSLITYQNMTTKTIYQSSICQTLTKGCYDFEYHHSRYKWLIEKDGHFIDNIIEKSYMNMETDYINNCERHKNDVKQYIDQVDLFNIKNEINLLLDMELDTNF